MTTADKKREQGRRRAKRWRTRNALDLECAQVEVGAFERRMLFQLGYIDREDGLDRAELGDAVSKFLRDQSGASEVCRAIKVVP